MATLVPNNESFNVYNIDVFWDNEFQNLDYIQEKFNNEEDVERWLSQGYQSKICGEMADMRSRQPSWNYKFVDFFESKGWKDIGTSYYRMTSGTVMPVHQDRYVRYSRLFDLADRQQDIRRALVMLEDWKSGHYLEVESKAIVEWRAGMVVEWYHDTPHMAANLGLEPRYTLQITGHV
jgi:hypothetical protein